MKIRHILLAAAIATMGISHAPQAEAGTDPYLGEMFIMPYTFCPRGTVSAEGQLLAINQYQALFSLLGTNYGGDGRTTFGMPDLRGRIALSVGSGPGLSPVQLGQKGGAEQTTILTVNMPSHTHRAGIQTYDDPANTTTPKGNAFGVSADNTFVSDETAPSRKFMNPQSMVFDPAGGTSAPLNNEQPYLVLRTCIATTGVFPSRN